MEQTEADEEDVPLLRAELLAELSAPTDEDFAAQARLVYDYADLRAERLVEILDQTQGTLAYFSRLLPLAPDRMPNTAHLLAVAQELAALAAQQCKHRLACRRPDAFSATIQPVIDTPGHSALPSGHATEAFAIAATLLHLLPETARASDLPQQLMAAAARIAVNRTVAGVHFPADSFAGAMLGLAVASAIASRAGANNAARPVRFSGAGLGAEDFYIARVWQDDAITSFATPDEAQITEIGEADITTDVSPLLQSVWVDAQPEWTR